MTDFTYTYTARADRNASRAAYALEPHYGCRDYVPSYPVTNPSPIAWWSCYRAPTGDLVHRTPAWLCRALERTARRWLRERGFRLSVNAVDVTQVGEILVHVHAHNRSTQSRFAAVATGLAARLRRVLVASDAIRSAGLCALVVSWGFDPQSLARCDADEFRARQRRAAA